MLANTVPMFKQKYLAHAFGPYEGHIYQNTDVAFRESYSLGFRYFEVDIKATTDNRLVLCHGFSKKSCDLTGMTYSDEFKKGVTHELFMKQNIQGCPVMDFTRFIDLMREFPDTYFELDLHTLDLDHSRLIAGLILTELDNNIDLIDRILIQVNDREMFKGINSVYNFPYFQYNVKDDIDNIDSIIDFCLSNQICSVGIKGMYITKDIVKKIKKSGLYILAYTIDGRRRAPKLLLMGVDTICTNYLVPGIIRSIFYYNKRRAIKK